MASPRKQRRLDEDVLKTPQKETNDENITSDSQAKQKIIFTPVPHFDWAEESAREYELSNSKTTQETVPSTGESEAELEDNVISTLGSGGPANRTRSRKKPTPQRADTRPKFEKSLDQRAALSFVRDERIKQLAAEKRRVEQGSSPQNSIHKTEDRKRRRSPSISTVSSNTPSRRNHTKAARLDDDEDRKNRKFASPRTPRTISSTLSTSRSHLSERANSIETLSPRPREDYTEPKRGWCTDEETLKRRTKEIEVTKSRPIYERYCNEVPVSSRLKSHPRTPNKYLNHSRRNWDSQVRKWKRSLYEWAGEYCPSSANTSRAASRANSMTSDDEALLENQNNNEGSIVETVKTFRSEEKLTFTLDNPDNMASLLGHFDMNTRQGTLTGDESTLKAHENRSVKNGPTDFSQLQPNSS